MLYDTVAPTYVHTCIYSVRSTLSLSHSLSPYSFSHFTCIYALVHILLVVFENAARDWVS